MMAKVKEGGKLNY